MRILITGSSGLVGTNLVKRLEKEHTIIHASRREGVDLRDYASVKELFTSTKPEIVYHLAANSSEARGQISPVDMTQRNLGIFVNVLAEAINTKVKRFIYTSSVAVYGEANVPYMEDGPTIPKDVYGVNKLAAELILKIMAKVYGFEYVIFRPHNIYGPGQNMNDPTKNVVALFMRLLMEGKPYKLYGEGKMCRAFSYVGDVVDVFVEALEPRFANKTMNVGAEHHISIKELSDMIQEITGIQGTPEMLPGRKQEISMFLADHTLQNNLIKYRNTPLKTGLQTTWEWVKKKGFGQLEVHPNEICL